MRIKSDAYIEYYAGVPTKIEGKTVPVPGERFDYTVREPLGVTAQIIPWNVPTLLGLRGIAPAIACGNTVVAKPSPEAPLSLIRLAELVSETGLPNGVFNVVPGAGPRTGEALITDDRTDHVTFTGSLETGTHVGKQAMDQVTPATLELGGKSPSILFPDADLGRAVQDSLAIYSNGGQVCYATTRLFVHTDIYDEFACRFSTAIKSLTVGPGDADPDVGPLITDDALQTADEYVTEAVQDGGRLLAGGNRVDRPGNFYRPILLGGVGDDAPISCNEVFAPVITMYGFSDEQEAIRRANNTEYGLYGTVWTNDIQRAHRVAHKLEAGTVTVNEYPLTFPQAPFGGYKKSEIGRKKGMQAVTKFTRLKNVVVNLE